MLVKKMLLKTLLGIFGILLILVLSVVIRPAKTLDYLLKTSSNIQTHFHLSTAHPNAPMQKTYTDYKHGYSFSYPKTWSNTSKGSYSIEGTQSGISVSSIDVEDCSTATRYFEKEVMPFFPDVKKSSILNPSLDGFVIEEYHLDNTPGPEAYIINCPYVIRLGFNPTGIHEAERLFDGVISSFKTWQPSE